MKEADRQRMADSVTCTDKSKSHEQAKFMNPDRQTDRQTDRQIDKQTDSKPDRQIERQTNRQSDRQ